MKGGACRIAMALVLVAAAAGTSGAEWYASPNGRPDAGGTKSDPLDAATAIGLKSPALAGDTIVLLGGRYRGPLTSSLEGTEERPITVRPAPGEQVTIEATGQNAAGLVVGGRWTVWRDLEVTCEDPVREAKERGRYAPSCRRPEGIVVRGTGIVVTGCIVHDCKSGIVCWGDSRDVEIAGCVIYNNGWQGPLAGHGEGLRAQSDEGVKRFVDNVIFNQFGYGMYLHTTINRVRSFHIEGNVSFNNGSLSRDGMRAANYYIGSLDDPVRDVVFTKNHAWHDSLVSTTCQLGIGLGLGDMSCTENTLCGLTRVMGWRRLEMTGNTFIGAATLMELHLPRTNRELEYTWRGNRYFWSEGDWSPMALYTPSAGGGLMFDSWKRQSGYDKDSTFRTGRPEDRDVVVRRDRHTPGRALVVVYNWGKKSGAEVDLGDVLTKGAAYQVLSAQDPLGKPVAEGTFDGSAVRLPTAGRRGPMAVGGSQGLPPLTGPLFNVYLVREAPAAPPAEAADVKRSREDKTATE